MELMSHAKHFTIIGMIILVSCFIYIEFLYLTVGLLIIPMVIACVLVVCGAVLTAIGIKQFIIIKNLDETKNLKK
ncbi:unnamed protein product [marine sediment metagenome]|uniref:Uncharacterized protein n=1 Tax=marine sediment metagenome TaxID=412755 RepID=X1A7N6_9ZZZZ